MLNCTKIPLIVCAESLDCEETSKLESVLQAKRKKIKLYVKLMKKWESLHLTLDNPKSEEEHDQVIIRIK